MEDEELKNLVLDLWNGRISEAELTDEAKEDILNANITKSDIDRWIREGKVRL